MSVRGYQKYEQGQAQPTPEILETFSRYLGCRPWELLRAVNETDVPGMATLTDAVLILQAFGKAESDTRQKVQELLGLAPGESTEDLLSEVETSLHPKESSRPKSKT